MLYLVLNKVVVLVASVVVLVASVVVLALVVVLAVDIEVLELVVGSVVDGSSVLVELKKCFNAAMNKNSLTI